MSADPTRPARAARRGLPRVVGILAIAAACVPLLYFLAFCAFFLTTKPIAIPSEVRFYSYAWSARDQLVARRLHFIRQPALVRYGAAEEFVTDVFFPLAYPLITGDGELVGLADAARVRACLARSHVTAGEGIICANDLEAVVRPRAGWWHMGGPLPAVKDQGAIPGKEEP
ncbi:MAG: hypothetical protein H0X38_10495 [Planctomycetes bacterium]|nr:hypothetical protein [Planctomycetota bacterium]